MRILIAEDEAIFRFYLTNVLTQINGEVVSAKSAEEAIEILKNDSDYDLIITDIQMNKLNGFELIEEAYKINNNIKFIVESAYLDSINVDEYKDRVLAFLQKPIDLNLLESIIRQIHN